MKKIKDIFNNIFKKNKEITVFATCVALLFIFFLLIVLVSCL